MRQAAQIEYCASQQDLFVFDSYNEKLQHGFHWQHGELIATPSVLSPKSIQLSTIFTIKCSLCALVNSKLVHFSNCFCFSLMKADTNKWGANIIECCHTRIEINVFINTKLAI